MVTAPFQTHHCTCGHGKLSHYYVPLVGDNSGKCLALNCTCTIYDEEEES